ncbi:DUF262 domain-containing protein [Peribacillus acanthi]|uniref:DUF262 domain-containing protein n=1 Tax=Peribacillus acanthi TaxID=2171554 RepID=UPI000D3E8160|nr:DUF262 domain-containing protein [Peribacillus acanthi]
MTHTDINKHQFSHFILKIEEGVIKIPKFQRKYVWTKKQAASLLDSIFRGLPVGVATIWRTNYEMKTLRGIGGFSFPNPQPLNSIDYVLDGQQRLTSLYCALNGLKVITGKKEEDFSEIYVNLDAVGMDQIVYTSTDDLQQGKFIKVCELYKFSINVIARYDETLFSILQTYSDRLKTYNFGAIILEGASLEEATLAYERANTEGKKLDPFEVMIAHTFKEGVFDLEEQAAEFLSQLKERQYNTIKHNTLLYTVSTILTKECTSKAIYSIQKDDFIKIWPKAMDALAYAVDFLRNDLKIKVSSILPYDYLLVPLAYFFYHHGMINNIKTQALLQDFFWKTALSERYTAGQPSKIAQDIIKIEKIMAGEQPEYDSPIVNPEFIKEKGRNFDPKKALHKTFLCLLASKSPMRLNTGADVVLDNSNLKSKNSKNYHHFYPKAFLKDKVNSSEINHICNIVLLDAYTNQEIIRDKSPNVYMDEFELSQNKLDSHLIPEIYDDYKAFINARAELLASEFNKVLLLT